MPNDNNGGTAGNWGEYKRLVLAELKRLNESIDQLKEGQQALRNEVAMLKVKSGLWGLAAGAVPVLVMLAWKLLSQP